MKIDSYITMAKTAKGNEHIVEIILSLDEAKKVLDGRSKKTLLKEFEKKLTAEVNKEYNDA